MDKLYAPGDIESRIYARWESSGRFAPQGRGQPYCIVIPPPNVTGTLHMGHAFQDTIMDALTRYHRMRGDDTLWQPGTDHAGIATQMVVERQLNAEGKRGVELGRDKFIERVWAWKAESGGTIARQMRRLGASVDWSRDRFTMDPKLSRAVTEVFVRLHDEGLIYRGQRLVNWDPVLQTAISDLEVVSEEEDGFLWHIRYPLADGSGSLSVATTRPETMLGDVAVAVHPQDERYRALVGSKLRLPIAGREIPIVADDFVDREFGSGCVKITPAHDRADYDVGLRHALPMINIFTPTAHLNDTVPVALRGLERSAARQRVLELLAAEGLLEKTEPHRLKVPRGDRTGVVLEPYLTDQWFVRAGPLADPAIDAVEQGRIRFVPENWSKTYYEWMRNIQDWCISRQLWWGHRIPAWYDAQGRIYVGRDEAEARQRHKLPADLPLRQDDDVLDTWFSSALWPFSTMGWPDETPELSKFYPTSVLVTGFDIIFFWVARMAMMGLKFRGDVPFREVYVHGLVRDSEGQKMSKSKGNVIDPLDVIDGIELEALVRKRTTGLMQPQLANNIEKATRKAFPDGIPASGTDALRFTFASLATQSRDIRFDVKRVEGYRNFCNKLWNAARFVFMSVEDKLDDGPVTDSVVNQWVRSRFGAALRACDQGFAEYRFDYAASALYEFTWYEFCDWYLELVKPVINGNDATAARGVRRTLLAVLDGLLRALHPLMPFITEEIFAKLQAVRGAGTGQLLMSAAWPDAGAWPQDLQAEREVRWIQALVLGIRQIRGEMDISPARPLPVLVSGASAEDRQFIELHRTYLARLANLESLREFADGEAAPPSAMALSGSLQLRVPMAGLIDPRAELERLTRRIAKLEAELAKARGKLRNDSFVRNAPADVVTQERDRVAEFERATGSLTQQLAAVQQLIAAD